MDLQKKNFALNRFYQNLSQPIKDSTSPSNQESKKRDVGKVVVSYFISALLLCILRGAKVQPFFVYSIKLVLEPIFQSQIEVEY